MAYIPLPKFNVHSYYVANNSVGKLLPPQSEALRKLQDFFDDNPTGRIGLISMPTGSGKSGIISCLPYFLGKSGLNPPPAAGAPPNGEPLHKFDKPVLVIAPDLEIASQLEGTLTICANAPGENFLLKRKIIENADHVLPQGVKIQETRHIRNPEFLRNKDIVIANAQKFLQGNWEDPQVVPNDTFKLVIVDEAHHHPASTWRRIVQKFKNHAMVVFLTATNFRADGQLVLDPTEGEVVYHLSLEQAREGRIIRRINWVPRPLHNDNEDLNNIYSLILEQVHDIQQAKDRENALPDNIPHMAIAITKSIDHAEQVADLWNDRNNDVSAIAYHSDVPLRENRATKQAIRNNDVKLLVIVGQLLEGFDHPPISIAAIMTKIASPVKFAQFIGRAQRIVRGREGPESEHILADVITHGYFQQEQNIEQFEEPVIINDE